MTDVGCLVAEERIQMVQLRRPVAQIVVDQERPLEDNETATCCDGEEAHEALVWAEESTEEQP